MFAKMETGQFCMKTLLLGGSLLHEEIFARRVSFARVKIIHESKKKNIITKINKNKNTDQGLRITVIIKINKQIKEE